MEDGSWGMSDEENSKNIPLSIIGGGTDGNTKQEAQLNLGLGCGLPPVGIPFYWSSAAIPNTVIPEWSGMTFLKLNGANLGYTDLMVDGAPLPHQPDTIIRWLIDRLRS